MICLCLSLRSVGSDGMIFDVIGENWMCMGSDGNFLFSFIEKVDGI